MPTYRLLSAKGVLVHSGELWQTELLQHDGLPWLYREYWYLLGINVKGRNEVVPSLIVSRLERSSMDRELLGPGCSSLFLFFFTSRKEEIMVLSLEIGVAITAILQCLYSTRTNICEYWKRHDFNEILFKKLETTMLQVNAVLSDAEEKQITNPFVIKWIDELKDAAYRTTDLLDEIHSMALAEFRASDSSDKSDLTSAIKNSKSKLEKMTTELDNLAKQKDVLGLKEGFSGKPSPRLQLTSLVDETELSSLQKLHVKNMRQIESIDDKFYGQAANPFASLRFLKFEHMPKWENWSTSAVTGVVFPSLQKLHIQKCENLIEIPNCLPSLKELFIQKCGELKSVGTMEYPQLQNLAIQNCVKLQSMPEQMHILLALQTLDISGCPELVPFPKGGLPSSLQILTIKNCVNVNSFPDEGLLPASLTFLHISEFPNLQILNLSGLQYLTLLKSLEIHSCNQLQFLSENGSLPSSLPSLAITGCSLLTDQCQRDGGGYWDRISHIETLSINGILLN
ncbi:hypothetical protein Q3G72_028062 [Acer saccharum]|nr:hypothetical protein Q3G72_028062 [Acer saccharum]